MIFKCGGTAPGWALNVVSLWAVTLESAYETRL